MLRKDEPKRIKELFLSNSAVQFRTKNSLRSYLLFNTGVFFSERNTTAEKLPSAEGQNLKPHFTFVRFQGSTAAESCDGEQKMNKNSK